MSRKYRKRSPRLVMEMIATAIHDNKEGLSYLQLKRAVEGKKYLNYSFDALMPMNTFRIAIKKLRHSNILKTNSPEKSKKRKKIPVEFTNQVNGKYPFISIPDTYMLTEEYIKRELNAGNRLSKNRPTRETVECLLERHQQLVQYFLIRAAFGISLFVPVTDTSEIKAGAVDGLYSSLDESNGHTYWHYPEDYFLLSEEEKRRVTPIIYKGCSLPGVSVTDLIMKRDSGNGGLFRHIRRPTKKEALKAIDELVDQGILTPMTREEWSSTLKFDHDLTEQEKDSIMRFEKGETRYKIAKHLADYVMEWSDLLGRILGIIGMILLIKSENVKELRDFYEYCYGPKSITHLRNQIRNKEKRREEQKIKQDVDPRYLRTPSRESLHQQAEFYGELVLEDLASIIGNMEYRTIQEDHPLLNALLTRVKVINDRLQQVLREPKKTEGDETNYKRKLRQNKHDYEKWKHISFG